MWAKAIENETDTEEFLLYTIIADGLGLHDVTKEELSRLWSWKDSGDPIEYFAVLLSNLISTRAQIGVR